jgi:hypothetical protein
MDPLNFQPGEIIESPAHIPVAGHVRVTYLPLLIDKMDNFRGNPIEGHDFVNTP